MALSLAVGYSCLVFFLAVMRCCTPWLLAAQGLQSHGTTCGFGSVCKVAAICRP